MDITPREDLLDTIEFNFYQPIGFVKSDIIFWNRKIGAVVDHEIKKLKEQNTKLLNLLKDCKEVNDFIVIEDSSIKNFWSKVSKKILFNGLIEQSKRARQLKTKLDEVLKC